jgi:glycine betaine/proline transport system permease protein
MMVLAQAIPRLPLGEWVDQGVDWVKANLTWLLDGISTVLRTLVDGLNDLLLWPPALATIALLALFAWLLYSWKFAVVTMVTFLLIDSMQMWRPAMQTLGLVLVATAIATIIAIPIGIAAARNSTMSTLVRPVLDFMQTMPGFVYLVPVVIFFSIGVVPGVVATIIFAMPPGVRLTELAIRQVDEETVEAGRAFGATPREILWGIQIPLGMPTIMAGVNQVIMLALSMAVIAGFVGAGGLGQVVVQALARVDIGQGFEGGLAIVILAIYLDRITGAIGQPSDESLLSRLRGRHDDDTGAGPSAPASSEQPQPAGTA